MVSDIDATVEHKHDLGLSNSDSDQQSELQRLEFSKKRTRNSPNGFSGLIAADDSSESLSSDEDKNGERLEERLGGSSEDTVESNIEHSSGTLVSKSLNQGSDASAQPKIDRAKEKRAKRDAQKSTTPRTANAGSEPDFQCAACQARFNSKTRLFNHIKEYGHAQPTSKSAKGWKGEKR